MEDTEHNQRLIRAALVCFLLVSVWWFLFPPQPPGRVATPSAAVETATTAPHLAIAPAPTATVTAATVNVKPELFHFEGAVPDEDGGEATPFRLSLTNIGGGIERFELPSYYERDADNQRIDAPIRLAEPIVDSPDLSEQMAGLEFLEGTTFTYPRRPVFEVVHTSEDGVRYRYVTVEGVEIEREYRLDPKSFQIELAVTVRNKTRDPQRHRLQMSAALRATDSMESGGFMFMPPPDHLSGMCFTDGSVEREAQKALVEESETFRDSVKWVGTDRQYFLAALIQRDDVEAECTLSGRSRLAKASLALPEVTLRPGEERRHKFTAYVGVKKPELLTLLDSQLEAAIDYSIMGLDLAPLCEALLLILAFIHGLTGSWGLAILGLTVLVKVALFPLNQRSGKSMRAMSALKPEMDKIKLKFPDDRQRQSEETMKLYRTHNVSPASGCVPMLLQMPIWFALYRSLWVSVDLYQRPFMWIPDLTARDPYWILPVALVAVMFLQQKMTPTTMDAAQQKVMMYAMPLMFGVMMSALPAGLCFYIFVNTVLTIVQQHFINKSIGPIGGSASEQGAPA